MDKFLKILDSISKFEEKIGLRKIIVYILLGFLVYGVFNMKTIVKDLIEIQEEIHNEKMEYREELTINLKTVLRDTRLVTGADRVLYFEYHNSKENPVGIPFKYFDLVLLDTKEELYLENWSDFKDINIGTSFLLNIQEEIQSGTMLFSDSLDSQISKGFEYQDGSKYQVIMGINVDGISESGKRIDQTVGFMVLEWMDTPKKCSDIDIKERILESYVIEKTENYIKQSSKIK